MISSLSGTGESASPRDVYTREEVVCNICGIEDEQFLYNIPERVVQCRRCGLVYLNPRLDQKSLKKIYSKGLDLEVALDLEVVLHFLISTRNTCKYMG